MRGKTFVNLKDKSAFSRVIDPFFECLVTCCDLDSPVFLNKHPDCKGSNFKKGNNVMSARACWRRGGRSGWSWLDAGMVWQLETATHMDASCIVNWHCGHGVLSNGRMAANFSASI
jgi:hypothetical protein